MKIFTLIYVVLTVLVISSCQKDNSEDSGQRIRLKKMADNIGMEGADIFSYDSDGHLTSIQIEGSSKYGKRAIKYNSKGQPYEITYDYSKYTIEWNENGFTINDQFDIINYTLDSRNQVKSSTSSYIPYNFNYNWVKADSLSVIASKSSPNYIYTKSFCYKLINKNSCFKGINIAVIIALQMGVNFEMVDFQNLYCPSIYKGEFNSTISYDFNSQNYPTRAVMNIKGDPDPIYTYFEYETY